MKRPTAVRLSALTLAFVLVGSAIPAVADEIDPVDPGVTLTAPGSVLTLPNGDGVRDTVRVTVAAASPTQVVLDILDAGGEAVVSASQSVALTDEALSAPVTLSVAGLPAGQLTLRATPTDGGADPLGASVTVPLTVGSGKPASVKLSLSERTIYTWSKAALRSSVASVSATDETGSTIAFTGTVTAKTGSKTHTLTIASKTGATAKATLSSSKLGGGTASVTAKVTGASSSKTSSAVTLAVKNVAIASTKISTSTSTIYPSRDGYKDSVRFSVSSRTTTGGTIPASGSVKVTSRGKTIASWKLTSSKPWSATWKGSVNGKPVYGTFTVTASIKGPEGSIKKATQKIVVKKGKLVTKTTKKTVKAGSVISRYQPFDYAYESFCEEGYRAPGDVFCMGYDAYETGVLSLIAEGKLTVPSAVVSAQKYGGAKVRISAKASVVYNTALWLYGADGRDTDNVGELRRGSSGLGWSPLPATTKKVSVALALGEYSYASVDTFTVEYSYKSLVTR